MAKITIYHNPRCQKSRQTLDLLNESGKEVEVIQYLKEPLKAAEIKKLSELLNIKTIDLIRKKEEIYLTQYKDAKMSDSQWAQVIEKNPILLERPIVVYGDKAVIGRPPELVNSILK